MNFKKIRENPSLFLALAFGASSALADNMFVTINMEGSILEYNTAIGAGSQSVFASNIYGSDLFGLAIDTNGNVFASVANSGDGYGFIYEFTPTGSQSTWASELNPYCLVFRPDGNLFAAGHTSSGAEVIYEFTPGGSRSTFYSGVGGEAGAFDSSTNLYIANGDYGTVIKFTPSGVESVFASGFDSSYGLAFDSKGNLFMSDFTAGDIYKFTNSGGTLSSTPTTFATGFNTPRGLAFDSGGNLFLADQNACLIYEFTNSGGVLSSNAAIFANLVALGYLPEYFAFGLAPPSLTIASSGSNSAMISWPSPSTGYFLQTNSNLATTNWTLYTGTIVTNGAGTTNSVAITPPVGNLFFRLAHP
jgi:hypothetical protein